MTSKRRRFPRSGADPTYHTAHAAVRAERGRPSEYPCHDCSGPAVDWSYDNSDPREFTDRESGCAYSALTSHYLPRCRSCHRKADWDHKRSIRRPLDPESCKFFYEAGCSAAGIARSTDWTAQDVLQVLRDAGVEIRGPGQNARWLINRLREQAAAARSSTSD